MALPCSYCSRPHGLWHFGSLLLAYPHGRSHSFDGLGQDKFRWAARQLAGAVSGDQVALFCGLCKLAAALGFWIMGGRFEAAATFCQMIFFALVCACHYAAFGDSYVPTLVLTLACFVKVCTLPDGDETGGAKNGKAD